MYDKIKRIHFVGIGGIGMSGIAEVLLNLGYQVSGTDVAENANVKRLRQLGAAIALGHAAQHVGNADAVVYSSAVAPENPELLEAGARRIPVVPRAGMLAELMRLKYGIAIAGTHGKTTTTSLIATILAEAGMDPTVVNGGILKALGSNAHLGSGQFLVTEADESDGSFLKLTPTIAVVTNMDPEHMEHYGTFKAVRKAYRIFADKVPFYGLAVLCRDHPEVANLIPHLSGKRVVTYGLGDGGDYRAVGIVQHELRTRFQVLFQDRDRGLVTSLGELDIALLGRHNVSNTLAAVAVAQELDIPWEVTANALAQFKGVQRRLDLLLDTPELIIIDDYGHHPVEIRATLAAVREGFRNRRLVVCFQPHRYSRVQAHLEEFLHAFNQADLVLVDRIYPAGETPPPGLLQDGGQGVLGDGIARCSGVPAIPFGLEEDWQARLEAVIKPGDILLFLGAGSVTYRARSLAEARSR